ncbi:cathepsin L-like peptidase [Amblyomma americanum]
MYEPPKDFDKKSLPKEVDWRKHNIVTGPKDQKECGSCWAFGTTGALEGQHAKNTGKLVSLSEQNLIDCSGKFNNQGCKGGHPAKAFRYIIANGGIDTEDSYPYEAANGTCRFKKENIGATMKDYYRVKPTEEDLEVAVANVGPIAVGINAESVDFMFYKQGIIDSPRCPKELTHAVLLVGYGVQDGKKYWIIKNRSSMNIVFL